MSVVSYGMVWRSGSSCWTMRLHGFLRRLGWSRELLDCPRDTAVLWRKFGWTVSCANLPQIKGRTAPLAQREQLKLHVAITSSL